MGEQLCMDGNMAASRVAYFLSDNHFIFPITPSSPMAENVDLFGNAGRKNIFGQTTTVRQMQAEGGAAGAVHGALMAGGLASTFTSSQGLLLMIPNLYHLAGEGLPGVIHVATRTLGTWAAALSPDHTDVYACKQTGMGMFAAGNCQEAQDFAFLSHYLAIKCRLAYMNFFEGFRVSHEVQKISILTEDQMKKMYPVDLVHQWREDAQLSPEKPYSRNLGMGEEMFMVVAEARNTRYDDVPAATVAAMKLFEEVTGRKYMPYKYFGHPEADRVVVIMGSGGLCVEEVVEHYNRTQNEKIGVVRVLMYRPFDISLFVDAIPKSAKTVCVLDRGLESGASAEPLYLDVLGAMMHKGQIGDRRIVGGRYGICGKDFAPRDVRGLYDYLSQDDILSRFIVGITDDVKHRSIPLPKDRITTVPEGTEQCLFFGLGADGTVGACRMASIIVGEQTDLNCQLNLQFDGKKTGGATVSHLRFGPKEIKSTYYVDQADYIGLHNSMFWSNKWDPLIFAKDGATLVINTRHPTVKGLESKLPARFRRHIARKGLKLYAVDALKVADEAGMGSRINMIMTTIFFRLSTVVPFEKAISLLKASLAKTYKKQGPEIVEANLKLIDQTVSMVDSLHLDYPADEWKNAELETAVRKLGVPVAPPKVYTDIYEDLIYRTNRDIPVSEVMRFSHGIFPTGHSKYEKRGVAYKVATWDSSTCIQCNMCSYSCPHAAVRPFVINDAAETPEGFDVLPLKGFKSKDGNLYKYRIQVSPLDCLGCTVCTTVCPKGSLSMELLDESLAHGDAEKWDFAISQPNMGGLFNTNSVKNSQFKKPYLEFSGACAGCCETTYMKLLTQLFGDRMVLASAVGCMLIWGHYGPVIAYSTDEDGNGPAIGCSLFEDNAEFGYGIAVSHRERRQQFVKRIKDGAAAADGPLKDALESWMAVEDDGPASKEAGKAVKALLPETAEGAEGLVKDLVIGQRLLTKHSYWMIGGDGWSNDIDFDGLDHVLASGEDINIMIFDNEQYANTGGQFSKATPRSAVAKFCVGGKQTRKKDLGLMMMSYGMIYVAQVSMAANPAQTLKAIKEAEAYEGPSLIICYSPCIAHGIKGGMSHGPEQQKLAVACGLVNLYRYNPTLAEKGKSPLVIDSKPPEVSVEEFLMKENRFASLKVASPEVASKLQAELALDVKDKRRNLERMAKSTK